MTPNSAVDSRQQDGHPPCPCVIRCASEAKTGESVNRSLIKAQSDVEGGGFVGEDETVGRSGSHFGLQLKQLLIACVIAKFMNLQNQLTSLARLFQIFLLRTFYTVASYV